MGGGGVDGTLPPIRMSFFLENKTSAPEAFNSCSFIPRADFETSLVMVVAMVTRYDVISSRSSSQFLVKIHVFST